MNRSTVLENWIRSTNNNRVYAFEIAERKDIARKFTQAASELRKRLRVETKEDVVFHKVVPKTQSYYSIERAVFPLTKEELLKMIPCYSDGRVKNDRLREIQNYLLKYKYDEKALSFLEKEIKSFVSYYGYEGQYKPKGGRRGGA